MGRRGKFSPEVKERAVRLVFEHTEEHDSGRRPGLNDLLYSAADG